MRFLRYWIESGMETPEQRAVRNKAHLDTVTSGATRMKSGWARAYLPAGFWNMAASTATTRESAATVRGFPISPYANALEDMDARDRAAGE